MTNFILGERIRSLNVTGVVESNKRLKKRALHRFDLFYCSKPGSTAYAEPPKEDVRDSLMEIISECDETTQKCCGYDMDEKIIRLGYENIGAPIIIKF